MNYTIDDLIDLIARRDEHEAYYRTKLVEALAEHDRRVMAAALREAADELTPGDDKVDDCGIEAGLLRARADEILAILDKESADDVPKLVAEMERLRAEIVAVHGEIDYLYERLYEAAHCGSARECQLAVLALLDKDGETGE